MTRIGWFAVRAEGGGREGERENNGSMRQSKYISIARIGHGTGRKGVRVDVGHDERLITSCLLCDVI